MASGRISLLLDSPLRDMLIAVRGVPAEVKKQIQSHTKSAAEPIWFEETRARAVTRLQQRALVNSARVGVTARNVLLRSGAVGKTSAGTPVSLLAVAAEFGASPTKVISQHARKTRKPYKRRLGGAFTNPTRGGKVVYPAARDAVPRFAALWVQTALRTVMEALEKGSR